MAEDVVLSVEGVSKDFLLPHERKNTLKERILHFKKPTYERFPALRDINFEVRRGEFFGIVGRNGSGKSTLLKIIGGIYQPTSGSVKVNGTLTPFIELGIGFNPELTGRENVFLNGAILGLNRKEVEEKYDGIVKFAELERFMDQKLKNYSSGMQVRLAFSIAIQAHNAILLIDEVLAVGDERFQNKCISIFNKLKKDPTKTIIFVSHDMGAVQRFCDRAVVIHDSKLVYEGDAAGAVYEYKKLNFPETIVEQEDNTKKSKGALPKPFTVHMQEPKAGTSKVHFKENESAGIRIDWSKSPRRADIKNVGVALFQQDNNSYVFGSNTILDAVKVNGPIMDYEIKLKGLLAGRYQVKVGLFGESDSDTIHFMDEGPSFNIINTSKWEGVVYLDHTWRQ